MIDSILVTLVIYNLKIEESFAFRSLTDALIGGNQSASLFIYDNSILPQPCPSHPNWKIEYRHDPSNPGVSKAYNKGFEHAKIQNKKWILLADQDTRFPVDAFDKYLRSLKEFGCSIVVPRLIDQVGVASPLKFYFGGGQRQKKMVTDQRQNLHQFFFHNSGLLISADEFEKAGGYDENFPLDFSDFSFVHRLRKRNDFFVVASISCAHHLAATSTSTLDERLLRFASYLKAGYYFKRKYQPSNWLLVFRFFLRALKLTFQYRNFQFLALHFRIR